MFSKITLKLEITTNSYILFFQGIFLPNTFFARPTRTQPSHAVTAIIKNVHVNSHNTDMHKYIIMFEVQQRQHGSQDEAIIILYILIATPGKRPHT